MTEKRNLAASELLTLAIDCTTLLQAVWHFILGVLK